MRNEKLLTVSLCFLIIAIVVGKTMKIYLRLLIRVLHHAKWKTFIVFLNYRNGCMQDYEDVLKRAPSCEMSVRWSADGSAPPLNESHIAGLLVWMKKKKKPQKETKMKRKSKTKRIETEITTRSALFLNCSQENFLGWQFCQVFKFSGHLPELDIGNLEEMLIWQLARGHKVLIDNFWSSSEVQESDLLLTKLGLTYMWTRYI